MRFFVLAIIGGIVITYLSGQDYMKQQRLEKEGVISEGIITSGESRKRRRSRSYDLQVTYFTQEGTAHAKKFPVQSSYFNAHTDSHSITDPSCQVRYLPSDPNVAMIVGGSNDASHLLLLGLGALAIGIGGVVYNLRKSPADGSDSEADT